VLESPKQVTMTQEELEKSKKADAMYESDNEIKSQKKGDIVSF
jgi:hypothetical protein